MKTTILLLLLVLEAAATTKIQKPRSTGKDYYIVFPKAANSNPNVGVLLNSPTAQTVTITAKTNHVVKIATPRTSQYVGGLFQIVDTPEKILRSVATRITSPDPIGVVAQYGLGGISGTYTPIPVSAWGREYYAAAPPEGVNTAYTGYPAIYSVPMITIIASHAGTSVTITPTAKTATGHAVGVPFNVTLNQGDVYNITTNADPQATNPTFDPCYRNLSGTHIVSNWPIGVVVSQSNTGALCDSSHCGDYCVEWLPPVCNLDSIYILSPSVPRPTGMAGEFVEFVFTDNETELIADDGLSNPRIIGTYNAGDMLDWPQPLYSEGLVLRASHPFLAVEYTRNATNCGAEPWTMSMNIITGPNKWSDFTPFSSAFGSQSIANLYFKFSDAPKLKLNGKNLLQLFPIFKHMPEGYAVIPFAMTEDAYYELTGDSGASAGGTIFGYGTKTSGKAQSFSHPIGANCTPTCYPDVTPPHDTVSYGCGIWTITGMDDELQPPATGLYDIWLAENAPPDSSFNVHFNPAPIYGYGDSRSSQFHIEVYNLAQPAQACLHFRDGAGNEYDTVLVYTPQIIDAVPSLLDVGAVRSGDSVNGVITLFNRSNSPVAISYYRLKYGASKDWFTYKAPDVPASPTAPFSIPPHDSIKFYFRYQSPGGSYVKDSDTLFITTCREFPIAALLGQKLAPAIFAFAHDFGYRYINPQSADTLSADVFVTNMGTDPLHVTNATLVNTSPNLPPLPEFTIVSTPPTPTAPWVIAPGDSAHVTVLATPRTAGLRTAYISFENDANHQILDSAALQMVALAMPVAVKESSEIPNAMHLAENYPNPFTDATTIAFDAPEGNYLVAIFNSIGEKVGEVEAVRGGDGKYAAMWNAGLMPGGMYFYRVTSMRVTGKLIVVK